MARASEVFSGFSTPALYFEILRDEPPMSEKFTRIRERIENSPFRTSSELPTGFNPVLYILSYPDLFEAEVVPYEHFILHGRDEGREWH
jgi:hypothetical protein